MTDHSDKELYRLITNVDGAVLEFGGKRMILVCHAITAGKGREPWVWHNHIQCFHGTPESHTFTYPLGCGPLDYQVRQATTHCGAMVKVVDQAPVEPCWHVMLNFQDGTLFTITVSDIAQLPDIRDFQTVDQAHSEMSVLTQKY
jgi:hypothetical protein